MPPTLATGAQKSAGKNTRFSPRARMASRPGDAKSCAPSNGGWNAR